MADAPSGRETPQLSNVRQVLQTLVQHARGIFDATPDDSPEEAAAERTLDLAGIALGFLDVAEGRVRSLSDIDADLALAARATPEPTQINQSAGDFNRWLDSGETVTLYPGEYDAAQLRGMLWIAWRAALAYAASVAVPAAPPLTYHSGCNQSESDKSGEGAIRSAGYLMARMQAHQPEPVDYDALDPGIREVVRLLNANGFVTSDSGDGVSKAAWIADGDALPYPHVAVAPVDPRRLYDEANRMTGVLDATWTIQATYDPRDGSGVLFAYQRADDVAVPAAPHEREQWITHHVDQGHGITKRYQSDECSCGATFWWRSR